MEKLYVALKYLTLPAGLIRAMIEQSVCKNYKIEIDDNNPIKSDETASHIDHSFARSAISAFALCFRPFFFCSLLSFFVGVIPTLVLIQFQMFSYPAIVVHIIALYLAISLFLNSFPMIEDAINMIEKLYKSPCNILLKIICMPGAAVCFIGAYLERYNLTIVLVIGVIIGILM